MASSFPEVQKAAIVYPPEEFFGRPAEPAGAVPQEVAQDDKALASTVVNALREVIAQQGECSGHVGGKFGTLADTERFRDKCCSVCKVANQCREYGLTEEGLDQPGVLGGWTLMQRKSKKR